MILSRILTGIGVGVVSFAGPLYLGEIAPKEKRGQIVSFHQIAITLGILFSYFSNYMCANLVHNWRIMLLIGAFPAFVLLLGMFFQKDTPRWLILNGKTDEAKYVLEKFKTTNPDEEIKNIKKTANKEKIVFSKKLLKPFMIGIGLMFAQIATGINAIIYYTPSIFKMTGFETNKDALFATIFIGLINFLMTFPAVFLSDKIGRKPLLYTGLSGMGLSLFILAFVFVLDFSFIKYLALIFTTLYIVSFSMSLGPIALLLISEIFPLKYRGFAMSISIVANFIFNFITTGVFPVAIEKLGGFITFMIFAFICLISFIFVYFAVPETKGISLEEIEQRMSN